jgi:transketolase
MRTTFVETLLEVAQQDSRVWLLTGDLGYSVLERFRDQLPDRYLNVGVAEQNLAGVAAGLASTGRVPFIYSIANFPTLRCFEQIRNDIVYHHLPVRIVSVGAGYAYGVQGYTHHGLEDIAVMRSLPGMNVFSPCDAVEAREITRYLVSASGPAYLRLGKSGEPKVHGNDFSWEFGRAAVLREGTDVTVFATGSMVFHALRSAEELERVGVTVRVLSVHTIKPLDESAVATAARNARVIVTAEEHSEIGGLGSAVSDVVARMRGVKAPVVHHAALDVLPDRFGSQAWHVAQLGSLSERIRGAMRECERGI